MSNINVFIHFNAIYILVSFVGDLCKLAFRYYENKGQDVHCFS